MILGFSAAANPEQDAVFPTLANANIGYFPNFLASDSADEIFHQLLNEIPFQTSHITLYGKTMPIPRLESWHGDQGIRYQYSGKTLVTQAWTPSLLMLKQRLETFCAQVFPTARFNSVLCNLYRDGSDSMGWHSDDEPELGQNPLIASISFGQVRPFKLQHKKDKELKWQVDLGHGSLLIMAGETQHHWRHHIPKSNQPMQQRMNLTFRWVMPQSSDTT